MVEGIPASVQSTHIPGIWEQCDVPMPHGQTQEMARHFLNPRHRHFQFTSIHVSDGPQTEDTGRVV